VCSGRCSARPDTSCAHSTESRQAQANGAAMLRCAINSGIKQGAGVWSLTSASPMTGLGQAATCRQNSLFTHPQDLDGPVCGVRRVKIAAACAATISLPISNNTLTNRTFLFSQRSLVPQPTCTASFCVFFFYSPTGRLRHTSLQLECHRKPTTRKHSGSSARHSTTD